MICEMIGVDQIKPSARNTKKHTAKQIDQISQSIQKYGFTQPIVVDKNLEIIIGHGRFAASKKLGLKEVPCYKIENLSEKEVRELRIVDNKLNESRWDMKILPDELEGLDLTDFDFKIDFEKMGNPSIELMEDFNIDFNGEDLSGSFDMPVIKKQKIAFPKSLTGFNYVLNSPPSKENGVHCFLDDYQIERLWKHPENYVQKLLPYNCFLTPDFSLYSDMPIAVQIYNTYRNRAIGNIMQNAGVRVIPTVSWSTEKSYSFCFDGIETGTVVAISTIGVKSDEAKKGLWRQGAEEMIRRIKPKKILVYGGCVEFDFNGIETKNYENKITKRLKNDKKRV